jgi:hypothetical protein
MNFDSYLTLYVCGNIMDVEIIWLSDFVLWTLNTHTPKINIEFM